VRIADFRDEKKSEALQERRTVRSKCRTPRHSLTKALGRTAVALLYETSDAA